MVTKTKGGIFVLAAAVVWSSSRPSNPAARRCGPFQQSAFTAHDQHAPVAIPHCPVSSRPISHRRGLPSADRKCQRRLRSPKTQITHYKTTVPILHTATKTNTAVMTQPSSLFETARSRHTPALNPHRPTPASVRTPPAVSSLEAFRTPASLHPLAPVTGRRPKTLNKSGRCREPPYTLRIRL